MDSQKDEWADEQTRGIIFDAKEKEESQGLLVFKGSI